MPDINYAKKEFNKYLQNFDCKNDKIKLKIVPTFGVVKCASEIAKCMRLSEEDRQLAEVIALLHDIGRFEQVRVYDSFEPTTMDHAAFGVELLFGEKQMIRQFVKEDKWDDIIRTAIARHSGYSVGEIKDPRTRLHACIIRDADKLDNCRVKLVDSLQVILNCDAETVGGQSISEKVWESCLRHEAVVSSERETKMDYWVSYIAYFYDINFSETFSIIREKNYVHRLIARIPYSNPDTAKKMQQLEKMVTDYMDLWIEKKKLGMNCG